MVDIIRSFDKRCLSLVNREHLSRIKDWRNAQMDILRQNKVLTDIDQANWFEHLQHDKNQAIFAILELDKIGNMKFIGYCGITNIEHKDCIGEVSFLVDPERTKEEQTYETDFLSVLYMLCEYGFENLGLYQLFTETYLFRNYHIKILEDFGFKAGKILKERKLAGGKDCDSVIHSIQVDYWIKTKKKVKSELAK